ncbi:gamma-glutamylcyclotransferase [Pseudooceanicola sp.]|uniref:gamma-glutamylcyclotransferase n=1 Tax=Pseudooceanicola sp. TaxID=1914328 RepID=UPI00405850F1
MPIDPDAFLHHPGLARLIQDPETSYFRDFLPSDVDERMREMGRPPDWRRTDEEREATRHAALAGRMDCDLWVFAYGSLMWDPALIFEEVRRATVIGHSRAMVLYDSFGARGSPDAPGLMAALVEGGTCEGVAFRIPAALVDRETEILWRREMLAHAYRPAFLPARTAGGEIEVLGFVADPTSEMIRLDLSRRETVRCIATGEGIRGTSYDYLKNVLDHFEELRIEDPELSALLDEVQRLRSA